MRQLFVAGLSTSSGLVDSLTWLLQIKQAGTRDAYDSTLKAPLNPPTTAIIPPPPPSPLFPPVSQASQGSSDRRKSASGLFQVSQIRDGGDFHLLSLFCLLHTLSFNQFLALYCNLVFVLKNEWNWVRLLPFNRCSLLVQVFQQMWSQFICLWTNRFNLMDVVGVETLLDIVLRNIESSALVI